MGKLETAKYVRKPFSVEAVQVTEENFDQVKNWCRGSVEMMDSNSDQIRFIRVRTQNPRTEREKQAFVGDWVLKANGGFKIYPHKAFKRNFILDPNVVSPIDPPKPLAELKVELTPNVGVQAIELNQDSPEEQVQRVTAMSAIQKMAPRLNL